MIEKGKKVKLEYTGTFDDGTVFDASEKHGKPLEFESGAGQIIKGLDSQVMGMKVNEEKQVRIEAKDAYGDVNPKLVQTIPRDKLPADMEVKEGLMLMLSNPEGHQFPATVKKVTDTEVTLDMNHPLAGKDLNFKVKVISIE